MTINDLHSRKLILFECISGSRAYGTDTPQSDTDIRGVFAVPQRELFGFGYVDQVHDRTNDVVFYELRRFAELLAKNNPNMLELLCAPADCVLHRHPLMDRLTPDLFLSKLCRDSFAGYAISQIKKARGLNKKIMNPMAKERKSLLQFCYVLVGQGSQPLADWLEKRGWVSARCGLVSVAHARDTYALFYDKLATLGYRGIVQPGNDVTEVSVSSVPEGEAPVAYVYVNHDGYSSHCKDYRQYWEWVEKRNDTRYQNPATADRLEHGKNYDAKNMMHTFRLLDMAAEILATGEVIVRRPNRAELLKIRSGAFEYDELIARAEQKVAGIDELAQRSSLPDEPDVARIEQIIIEIREEWYG
ncbi:MAG: nucleotidyltransferase domain-containing protein [Rudanella sp.]|nr:nucleotidyltransferase domain-containing protein [Rudanella sp.]